MTEYSIFLDESGVEGYKNTDSHYIVAGLLIEKDMFVNRVMNDINNLKTKYFSNPDIIFHFFDMMRRQYEFKSFNNQALRNAFFGDYIKLLDQIEFKVLAAIVDKNSMQQRYIHPQAPKRVALPVIYENAVHFLASNDGIGKIFVEEYNENEDQRVQVQYHLTMPMEHRGFLEMLFLNIYEV